MADSTTAALTGTVILGALTFKGIDLVKYAIVATLGPLGMDSASGERRTKKATADKARDEAVNGLVTLALGCFVGVLIVFLFALTGFADQVKVGDLSLGSMGWTSKFALGLAMTSVAGVLFDAKKAVDNTDSASKVKLFYEPERDRQELLDESHRS